MVVIKTPSGNIFTYDDFAAAKKEMYEYSVKYKRRLSDFEISEDEGMTFRKLDYYDFSGEERPQEVTPERFKAEHPISTAIAPSVFGSVSGTEDKNLIQSIIEDALSLPGRGLGAAIDGVSKDGNFGDVFQKSLGERSGEQEDRGFWEGMIQGILRDSMLIPGMMFPASRIPGVASIGKNTLGAGGTFLKKDLLKPALEGAIEGLSVEAARPVVTTEEFDPLNLLLGMGLGGVLSSAGHNVLGGVKAGLSGLRGIIKETPVGKLAGKIKARSEINRFKNKTPEEILAEIEKEHGVKLDDYSPPEKSPPRESLYDIATDAFLGDDLPGDVTAGFLANANKMSPDALMLATSPSGFKALRDAYRTPKEIAEQILEDLETGKLIGENKRIWEEFLERQAQSGRTIKTDKIAEILDAPLMESKARESRSGMKAADLEKKMHGSLEGYAKSVRDENGANYVLAKDLDHYRKKALGGIPWNKLEDNGLTREEINTLKSAYHQAKEELLTEAAMTGNTQAIEAYERMADNLEFRDEILEILGAGKNAATREIKVATVLKNRASGESNAPKNQELYELLQKMDEKLGTNYAEQSRLSYYANQLSPSGEKFDLPDGNPHVTGKGLNNSITEGWMEGRTGKSAFVKTAQAKAKDMSKKAAGGGMPKPPGRPYGNPFVPENLKEKFDRFEKEAYQAAEASGYKPGTKEFRQTFDFYFNNRLTDKELEIAQKTGRGLQP